MRRSPVPVALLCCLLPWSGIGCSKVEARGLAKEGNELYREGKFEQALAKFEAAAKLDPEFPVIFLHTGYAAMSLAATSAPPLSSKFADKAISAFARYRRLAPNDDRGSKFFLQALLDADRLKEARQFLVQRHKENPRDIQVVASLGVVASKAGDFADALKWYEKRAELLPKDPKSQYLIGTLCWEHLYKNNSVVGAERIRIADGGIAALHKAVQLQPDSPGEALTYINLLYRERAKGQRDKAAAEADLAQARSYYERAVKALKGSKGKP